MDPFLEELNKESTKSRKLDPEGRRVFGDMYYLAGPFFNEVQAGCAHWIADQCKIRGQLYYAPVELGFVKVNSSQDASRIVSSNIESILASRVVLAHIDWLLPAPNEVRVVAPDQGDRPGSFDARSKTLNIPDSGTVWEMGFARGWNIPVVAYTLSRNRKVNVMLTETCSGFLVGKEEILDFLDLNPGPDSLKYAKEHMYRGEYF
jgi:nucleoside 2-deoxyribosyltransferase